MMSDQSLIIDAYGSYRKVIQDDVPDSVEAWITHWAKHYKSRWPTLYEMLLGDYREQEEDWRQIARERVFPAMNDRLSDIDTVYRNLSQIIGPIETKVRRSLGFYGPVCHVLYVGLGNGAGWVTKYEARPAILFGLEAIVDSGFDAPARLEGLVAHELGHVAHHTWRKSNGLRLGAGPWWQLYEEGFAQVCESKVLDVDSWHMRSPDADGGWLSWCTENQAWLAAEFLRTADLGDSVRPFFGSWYDLRGRKQTGYFLGHQAISHLADNMSLREIALLRSGEVLERTMRDALGELMQAG